MRIKDKNEILTTGQVAKLCHVAPRTVSKWFDTGKLRGYRIPGSRDRRIPMDQLVSFMQAHGIPMDALDGGCLRILVMDLDIPNSISQAMDSLERYDMRTAENGFEAGVTAQQFRPHVIVLDTTSGEAEAIAICQNIKAHSDLQGMSVLAAISEESSDKQVNNLLASGFDDCLAKPYSIRDLLEAVESATNIIQ